MPKVLVVLFSTVIVLLLVGARPPSIRGGFQGSEEDGARVIAQPALASIGERQNGLVFVAAGGGLTERFAAREADIALENLADTGATWVALATSWYQSSHTSTSIAPTASTDSDADLIHAIAQAHRLGLRVMLRPSVALLDYPDHWHGEIGTVFTSDEEWHAWFTSYAAFINHFAELAQLTGAEQLSLGNELDATTHRENDWRWVVTGVRARYAGLLVYGANWGKEAVPGWWDALDFIGVSAYYPLTNQDDPSLDELRAAWFPIVEALGSLAADWGKPVLLTEIGYYSLDGSNRAPSDCCLRSGKVDLEEQRNAYQAALESWYAQPWFAGMFWWRWDTNPLAGGPCDGAFTPRDKPAEDVLRTWYGRDSHRPSVPSVPQNADYRRAQEIYTDDLQPGWLDASWSAVRNYRATGRSHSGARAIAATLDGFGAVAFLRERSAPALAYKSSYLVEFYLYGTPQILWVWLSDSRGASSPKARLDVCGNPVGNWALIRLRLDNPSSTGSAPDKIVLQNGSGYPSPTFLLDDVRILPLG